LVNNAQVFKNYTSVMDHSDEDVYRVFNSGYMGTWRFMRECFPYMKDRGGKVVNMASAAGVKGLAAFAAYASTKEAIRALSRVAAREWGEYGINVNIICPLASSEGLANSTPQEGLDAIAAQLPVRRLGRAEDIAPIAVFLASRDSDYLTGYTFFADGGSSIDAGR
jgi:NAD(P)-dependent dehydrogenase (short-subunit alcohol dehydrogenase family)